jgi:hypothetical protein
MVHSPTVVVNYTQTTGETLRHPLILDGFS